MNIQELPEEVLLTLFEYLHFRDLRDLELVSRFFNSFIFKQNVYRKKYPKLPEYGHKLYFDDWMENNPYFNVRKMVTEFYKKRLHEYQFLEGRQIKETEKVCARLRPSFHHSLENTTHLKAARFIHAFLCV